MDTVWKKVQTGIVKAYNFGVPEYNYLQRLKKFKVNWSSREMTKELDLLDDYNVASIPEDGYEARPVSVKPVTATFTWILLNARFTMSLTSKYIQQEQGTRGQLVSQFKQQAKTKVRAVRQKIGNMLYGFSNGVIGHLTANNTGTTTLDLDNMYGVASLGGTSASRRVVDLLTDNEYYAITQSDGTFREIVQVLSVDRSTNIATTAANMGTTADGDLLVGAGSLGNTDIGDTDYDKHIHGLLDFCTTASIHNVTSATYSRWDVALEDTAGGRFTGVKLRKMKQAIANKGGGTMDTVIWSQGVENDVLAQLQAGLRFGDPFNMEMDGSPKSKGVTFMSTLRVPDGYVFGFDSKRSIKKGTLLSEPAEGDVSFNDGWKIPDKSGEVFSIDYPLFTFIENRANLAYHSGLTEQGL
jgi:hypothetical protein